MRTFGTGLIGLMVTATVVLGIAGCAPAPPAPAPGAAPPTTSVRPGALVELTRLAARRIAVSDTVAAAKFGTPSPIEDPAREAQVIAAAARGAADPEGNSAFFRDQIEASKVVQRGLFTAWTESPGKRPKARANLATVRPELDRLGAQMVQQLQATAPVRAGAGCPAALSADSAGVASSLDQLHRDALNRALRSVCRG